MSVEITGHRGVMGLFPENTLPSFKAALDLKVDVLEYDVHMTRDRELIIIHDSTVDRTTDGTGAVNFMTLEEIKKLDAGVKFDEKFKGCRVPTLRETLELFASYDYMPWQIVEIKDFRPEVVDDAVKMIYEFGLEKRTIIESGDTPTILYVQEVYPEFPTLVFPPIFQKRDNPKVYEKVYGVTIAYQSKKFTSKEELKALCDGFLAQGKKLYLFNADTPEEIDLCVELGATNLITNFADVATEHLYKLGLRDKR